MSSWAKPGVKCVCIDDTIPPHKNVSPSTILPKRGSVYTIRRVKSADSVWLEEIVNNPREYLIRDDGSTYFGEVAFSIARFRPLVEPKTEAEDFAMIKDLIKVPQDA